MQLVTNYLWKVSQVKVSPRSILLGGTYIELWRGRDMSQREEDKDRS